ncbi:MAG TPA: hypothetical protein VER12_00500 [Polyangiaceae bacterium]|nr:hypothetical protein [Polyangiaceae bacterium]
MRSIESLIVLRENSSTPTDRDWDEFLDILAVNRPNFPRIKILVKTDGGGPSAEQRKRLSVALGGKPVRVAVVTDSIKVRFIVSSIALLNSEIATFSNKEIVEAYQHLSLSLREQKLVEAAIVEMSPLIA